MLRKKPPTDGVEYDGHPGALCLEPVPPLFVDVGPRHHDEGVEALFMDAALVVRAPNLARER
jgi:hypothetical protein